MTQSGLYRFDVHDAVHGLVPGAVLMPENVAATTLPQCLFLYGGGGSRESLADIQALLESGWMSRQLPPMLVATPDVGPFSFYLDDPARGLAWESFIARRFIPHVQQTFGASHVVSLVGVSMGGYGALKLAFANPSAFRAVAVVSPMIEPAYDAHAVPARNRYFYPPEVPQVLLGSGRDRDLYRADHPALRARRQTDALLASELAIYIDAAGCDALHAHDGAEHLHRTLWDLDVAHEYRLRRDADHVGPDLTERLNDAFAWVGSHVAARVVEPLTETELSWQAWLDGAELTPPTAALLPSSRLFPRWLRAQLAAARQAAAAQDATVLRRYGVLPSPTLSA